MNYGLRNPYSNYEESPSLSFLAVFIWLFTPYLSRYLAMPGLCYAERIFTKLNLFITAVHFWGEILSFLDTFHLSVLMFSTGESSVHPHSVVDNGTNCHYSVTQET